MCSAVSSRVPLEFALSLVHLTVHIPPARTHHIPMITRLTCLRELSCALVSCTLHGMPHEALHHLTANTRTCDSLQQLCISITTTYTSQQMHDMMRPLTRLTQLHTLEICDVRGTCVYVAAQYAPDIHTLKTTIGEPDAPSHATFASLHTLHVISVCIPPHTSRAPDMRMFAQCQLHHLHLTGVCVHVYGAHEQQQQQAHDQHVLQGLRTSCTALQMLTLGTRVTATDAAQKHPQLALNKLHRIIQLLHIRHTLRVLVIYLPSEWRLRTAHLLPLLSCTTLEMIMLLEPDILRHATSHTLVQLMHYMHNHDSSTAVTTSTTKPVTVSCSPLVCIRVRQPIPVHAHSSWPDPAAPHSCHTPLLLLGPYPLLRFSLSDGYARPCRHQIDTDEHVARARERSSGDDNTYMCRVDPYTRVIPIHILTRLLLAHVLLWYACACRILSMSILLHRSCLLLLLPLPPLSCSSVVILSCASPCLMATHVHVGINPSSMERSDSRTLTYKQMSLCS